MTWTQRYRDRVQAGKLLAQRLEAYVGRSDLLVLALPRGGLPVAFEVAKALEAPLDLIIVRKLGVPGQEELAMGAIASGGTRVVNEDVLLSMGVSKQVLDAVAQREQAELQRREQAYRGQRPLSQIDGKCVILVDDGLATGATMRAAVRAVQQHHPSRVVVAVPVAPPDTVASLAREADEVVCPMAPEMFFGVGQFYEDFRQTEDEEIRSLLEEAWGSRKAV